MSALLDWLVDTWNDFVDFLYQIILSLLDMLKDLFIWIVEQLMTVAKLAIDGLGSLLGGLDIASYFSAIPPETGYYLNALGVSQGMAMIATALTIRFLLQLIPFVRLGS